MNYELSLHESARNMNYHTFVLNLALVVKRSKAGP